MQLNRLANELQHFTPSFRYSNTAGEIRNVRSIAALALLYYDKVFDDGAPTASSAQRS
jgi:hypothetical protein